MLQALYITPIRIIYLLCDFCREVSVNGRVIMVPLFALFLCDHWACCVWSVSRMYRSPIDCIITAMYWSYGPGSKQRASHYRRGCGKVKLGQWKTFTISYATSSFLLCSISIYMLWASSWSRYLLAQYWWLLTKSLYLYVYCSISAVW